MLNFFKEFRYQFWCYFMLYVIHFLIKFRIISLINCERILFLSEVHQNRKLYLYVPSVRLFLAIYWFDFLKIEYEKSKHKGNIQTAVKRKQLWLVLSYLWKCKLKIVQERAWRFWFAFLHNFEMSPNNFLHVLHFMIQPSVLKEVSSLDVSKRFDLSEFALRSFFENK